MIGRMLLVDDERDFCEMVDSEMRSRGMDVAWQTKAEPAFQMLKDQEFDVVVTDLRMPGMTGIELCDRIVTNRPDIPVLVITAFGSLDSAVQAIRAGAYDFVTKPVDMDILALAVDRALRHRALQTRVKMLSEAIEQSKRFDDMLGASAAMQELYSQLNRVAATDASVLITGESGTGKELVARSLHARSGRSDGPFVAINCSAVPETLLESELFGHARGAFTDAKSERAGLFREADGGTLLLDEIGELSLALQPKVLRALEERKVRPVGGSGEIPVDVRLVAATNRDLESAVQDKRFREDLYFRINVVQLQLPPLRARGSDVLLLAQCFLEQIAARFGKPVSGISHNVAEKLLAYDWPGNVRELRNAMERAVALTNYEQLAVEDLPERIRDYRTSRLVLEGTDPSELLPMEEVERRYIRHVLRAVGGNKTLAAKALGLDRKTLYRKLQKSGDMDNGGEDA